MPRLLRSQDKRIKKVVEEVCAGRREVLRTLATDELKQVLETVNKKKIRDKTYLHHHEKRAARRIPPKPPSLEGRLVYFVDPALLQNDDVKTAMRQHRMQSGSLKVWACQNRPSG